MSSLVLLFSVFLSSAHAGELSSFLENALGVRMDANRPQHEVSNPYDSCRIQLLSGGLNVGIIRDVEGPNCKARYWEGFSAPDESKCVKTVKGDETVFDCHWVECEEREPCRDIHSRLSVKGRAFRINGLSCDLGVTSMSGARATTCALK